MMMGAVEEHTQDRASEGEDRLKHVSHKHTFTVNILCLILALTFYFLLLYSAGHSLQMGEERI